MNEISTKNIEEAECSTLFSLYALPEEIASVRRACESIALLEGDLGRVTAILEQVELSIGKAEQLKKVDYQRAAAIALGEALPEKSGSNTTESLSQLNNQRAGLQMRIVAAREDIAARKGAFRAAVLNLIAQCAERCADDFVKATKEQGWCHQQLALAQSLVGNARQIIEPIVWGRYFVPASLHIPAMKKLSREEHFIPSLMSADRLSLTEKAVRADLAKSGRSLFGDWPL